MRVGLSKLLGGISGLMIIVATVQGVVSIGSLRTISTGVDTIATQRVPSFALLGQLNADIGNVRIAQNAVLDAAPEDRARFRAILTKANADFTADMQKYEPLLVDKADHDYFAKFKQKWRVVLDRWTFVDSMIEAGNGDGAKTLFFGTALNAYNDAGTILQSAVNDMSSDVQRESHETSQVTAFATNTTYATLGAAVLIGLLSAFFGNRYIARPLIRLTAAMRKLTDGDTTIDIPSIGRRDEIGEIAAALGTFREAAIENKNLEAEAAAARASAETERVNAQQRAEADAAERLKVATAGLAAGLKRLAAGDLSFKLSEEFAPDFEALRHDFNQSVGQLRTTLGNVKESVTVMETGTREIAAGADDLSRRTEQQAASLEQTAAAVEEITTNVRNAATRTEEARSIAIQANSSAEKSATVVANAEDAMRKIESSSQQISNIIGVIDDIAFQTNLLALNAGVEAARAGEAGKGFAVVAQEVRELAQRSAQAAKEIKQLIHASTAEVSSGVNLVRSASDALKTIGSFIVHINDHMNAIAISTREQSTGLAEVNQAVNTMDQSTQQNAAMVEESNAASSTLAIEAAKLRELINQFTLDDGANFQSSSLRQVARAMATPAPERRYVEAPRKVAAAGGGNWEEF